MGIDIDDAEAIEQADFEGRLPRAASAGAQVRAVANALGDGESLEVLKDRAIRTLIMVTDNSDSAIAAEMTAALASSYGRSSSKAVPVVVAGALPGWVGPLDCVMVAGENAADPRLVEACSIARHRGADLVVSAPYEGPIRDATDRNTIIIESPAGLLGDCLIHQFAAGVAVLIALGALSPNAFGKEYDSQTLYDIATLLDDDAMTSSPDQSSVVNHDKQLALSMQDKRVVFATDSVMTRGIVHYASNTLIQAGIVAGGAGVDTVLRSQTVLFRGLGAESQDLFFDPYALDNDESNGLPLPPLKVIIPALSDEFAQLDARVGLLLPGSLWFVSDGTDGYNPVADVFRLIASLDRAVAYLSVIGRK